MKNKKPVFAIIPAIGVTTFMLSFWLLQSEQENLVMGLSPAAVAGIIVGFGIGTMLMLLRKSRRGL
ncbi:hypothetical protein [Lacimicrobium sp. SS2-24]|uniref:hypothetical protein n=1 Tax=Lacimicrobium sp. SS2-24 TaxID=2005569 RepID=UPI000B4A78E9|nr:hypothetical protein [Lacimicrobium sp. SS2-24]